MRNAIGVVVLVACAGSVAPCRAQSDARELIAEQQVQALFDYLLSPRSDIGKDRAAQEAWLSVDLVDRLAEVTARVRKARSAAEKAGIVLGPDPHVPDNDTFLDAWDHPSACGVSGSRADDSTARVTIDCDWGRTTNYPGSHARYEVALRRQSGTWRVTDIRSSHDGHEDTLSQILRDRIVEARAFEDDVEAHPERWRTPRLPPATDGER